MQQVGAEQLELVKDGDVESQESESSNEDDNSLGRGAEISATDKKGFIKVYYAQAIGKNEYTGTGYRNPHVCYACHGLGKPCLHDWWQCKSNLDWKLQNKYQAGSKGYASEGWWQW